MLSFLKPNKLKVKSTLLILFSQIVFLVISSSLIPNLFPEVVDLQSTQKEIIKNIEVDLNSKSELEDFLSEEMFEAAIKIYIIFAISLIVGTYISVSLIIENFLYESK